MKNKSRGIILMIIVVICFISLLSFEISSEEFSFPMIIFFLIIAFPVLGYAYGLTCTPPKEPVHPRVNPINTKPEKENEDELANIQPSLMSVEEYDKKYGDDGVLEKYDCFDAWEGTKYDTATNYDPIPPLPDLNPTVGYVFDWYKWEVLTPKYKRARVNNHIIEFWGTHHTYRVDRVWVPSITHLVDESMNKEPDFLRENVVTKRNDAAKAAKLMKKTIFDYETDEIDCDLPALVKYKELKSKYGFSPIAKQLLIACFKDNVPLCAGTIDFLLQESDSNYSLLCLKSSSSFQRAKVTLQQNLYRIGIEQCSSRNVSEMTCLQIQDSTGDLKNIVKDEDQTTYILKRRYEEYLEAYAKWKIAKKNSSPWYDIHKMKLGDTVLYDGRKGIIKNIDREKETIEVHIVKYNIIVKTTFKDAQMREIRCVDFD